MGTMVFWIVWFVIGLAIVLLSVTLVLPRIMMRMHAATLPVRDRTVGRVVEEHGAAILCEPAPAVRGCIRSYRIGRDEKGVYFQGEWDRKIAFVQYEIVVYNSANEVVNVLRVKEKFNDGELTHVTRLPDNTDFVTLRLVAVDDTPFRTERKPFNGRYALWLAVLCVAVALTCVLLVWLGMTVALRCMDSFTATLGVSAGVWAELLGFTALGAAVLTCAFSLVHFFLMRKRGQI